MLKKLIIFDFDGTIADSADIIISAFCELIKKNETPEELRNQSMKDILKSFGVSKIKTLFLLYRIRKIFNQKISEIKPVENIGAVLAELKQKGFILGILSSNSKNNILKFLSQNKLELFDFVRSEINMFGKDKSMLKLAKKYGNGAEKVFYITDEVRDIEAAKKAGISPIAVTWGFNNENILKINNPDYLAHSPQELLEFLEK